jgi:hypothetical protein
MAESTDDTPDLISPALLELLAVFEGPLAEVRFPGVDRTSLRHLVDQVRKDSEKLEALKSQFEGLQNALTEAQTKLVRAAEQGLGYARVFAAGDPELSQRLADITLTTEEPKQRRRKLEVANPEGGEAIRLPPKRGRKPKSADPDPEAATG